MIVTVVVVVTDILSSICFILCSVFVLFSVVIPRNLEFAPDYF